jgi:hypothetical protein
MQFELGRNLFTIFATPISLFISAPVEVCRQSLLSMNQQPDTWDRFRGQAAVHVEIELLGTGIYDFKVRYTRSRLKLVATGTLKQGDAGLTIVRGKVDAPPYIYLMMFAVIGFCLFFLYRASTVTNFQNNPTFAFTIMTIYFVSFVANAYFFRRETQKFAKQIESSLMANANWH